MIKSIISKIIGRKQPKPRSNIFDTPVSFRTVEPDVRLSFDKWSKRFKVSSSLPCLKTQNGFKK